MSNAAVEALDIIDAGIAWRREERRKDEERKNAFRK